MGRFSDIPNSFTEKRRWQLRHHLQYTSTNPHRIALVALYTGYEAGRVTQYIATASIDRKYRSVQYRWPETYASFFAALEAEPDYQEIQPGSLESFLA